MTVAEFGALLAAAAALGALYLQIRRAPGERAKLSGETGSTLAATVGSLIADFETLRAQLAVSRKTEEDCKRQLAAAHAELTAVIDRLTMVEAAVPSLVIASKLSRMPESVARVLNRLRDGLVLTMPSEGGRFIWCNEAFADALGMTPHDVIATGWRALINPAYLEATEEVEGIAWSQGGEIVNSYRHRDGHYVQCRWFFGPYEEGASLSVVHFERRRRESGVGIA